MENRTIVHQGEDYAAAYLADPQNNRLRLLIGLDMLHRLIAQSATPLNSAIERAHPRWIEGYEWLRQIADHPYHDGLEPGDTGEDGELTPAALEAWQEACEMLSAAQMLAEATCQARGSHLLIAGDWASDLLAPMLFAFEISIDINREAPDNVAAYEECMATMGGDPYAWKLGAEPITHFAYMALWLNQSIAMLTGAIVNMPPEELRRTIEAAGLITERAPDHE